MKIITETVDDEDFVELALDDFDLDLIDDAKVISKDVIIGNRKSGKRQFALSLRKNFDKRDYEDYALD